MKRTFLIAISAALAIGLLSQVLPVGAQDKPGAKLHRLASGDVNGDGSRDISDTVYLLNWLFAGGPEPIKPDGEEPSAELLASIQANAAKALASLPSEELIAKLPKRISNGFLRSRKVLATAAAEALNWGRPEVATYTESVQWVAVFVSTAQLSICHVLPQACVDQECLDRCDDALQACMNGCPSPILDPIGYFNCSTQCSTDAVQCVDDCMHWSAR